MTISPSLTEDLWPVPAGNTSSAEALAHESSLEESWLPVDVTSGTESVVENETVAR